MKKVIGDFVLDNTKLYVKGTYIADCYQEIDGFYVIDFNYIIKSGRPCGQFNEYSLRLIADFLEELNKPLNKQLIKDLKLIDSDSTESAF